MPGLEDELLKRQISPMEDFAYRQGLGQIPSPMEAGVPKPGMGMASIFELLAKLSQGGKAVRPAIDDVFKRGLANQSARGSLLTPEQLRARAEQLFRAGTQK